MSMSFQTLGHVQKEVTLGNVKENSLGNLSLFKYTPNCVYNRAWNKINLHCRGIVFDTHTGTIVGRPFDKFFNVAEHPDTELKVLEHKAKKMKMTATTKLDGTMTSIWSYKGVWYCSTPGSITSPQAQYAQSVLLKKYRFDDLPQDLTYVCELITPWDRANKVVNYGDREELVLLAAFENRWNLTEIPRGQVITLAEKAGLPVVEEYELDPENPWNTPIPKGDEGFVVRFEDGFRVKVKSQWYMKWHRVIGSITHKNLVRLLRESGNPEQLLDRDAPSHAKEKLDDVVSYILSIKERIEREVDEWWTRANDHTDFKACAEVFKQAGPLQHILFARMRGNEAGERKALYTQVEARLKDQ